MRMPLFTLPNIVHNYSEARTEHTNYPIYSILNFKTFVLHKETQIYKNIGTTTP